MATPSNRQHVVRYSDVTIKKKYNGKQKKPKEKRKEIIKKIEVEKP